MCADDHYNSYISIIHGKEWPVYDKKAMRDTILLAMHEAIKLTKKQQESKLISNNVSNKNNR